MSDDTELLLVTLASLLDPQVFTQEELLNALIECSGDVNAASRLLQSSSSSTASSSAQKPNKKRRRSTEGLDSWINSADQSSNSKNIVTKKPRSTSSLTDGTLQTTRTKPLSNTKHPNVKIKNAFELLRASREQNKLPKPRLTPLTLATPELVAQHTPCTLHYSILPPELACDLFYAMLDMAKGWSRNKWFLFDRLVESPHRTSFFARVEGFEMEGDVKSKWNEAAKFW